MTRSSITFLVFLLGASPAVAQTLRLTVAGAITKGFENSHRLAEVRARETAAQAVVAGAEAADRPTATATGNYTRTNHVTAFGFPQNGQFVALFPDLPDNLLGRVSFQWPIYTSGRTGALEAAARAEASAVAAEIDTARADLRFEIVRAYWAGVTARESVRVLEESVTRAEAQLKDAHQRFDVGLIPPNEVTSLEAQRSREQAQLIEAKNLRESTQVDIRRLIGADPDTAIEFVDSIDLAPEAQNPGVPVAIKEALDQRSERVSLTQRIEAANERAKAASTQNKPVVGVAGGFEYTNPNRKRFPVQDTWQNSFDLGVNVSWSFLDWGRTKAQITEATAQASAVRERLAEFDSVVAADVRQRLLDLDSSRAMVAAASDAVKNAAEARRVVGDRYSAGVATSTDLLAAQVALLENELTRTRALAGVKLAQARLERSLGRQ